MDFWHNNDRAYLLLAVILAVGGMVIVALTWRDSIRALKEFFAPLRKVRIQFRVIHLFMLTALFSIFLRAALWAPWSATVWGNFLCWLAICVFAVSLLGYFFCLFWSDTTEKRARLKHPYTPPGSITMADEEQKRDKPRFPEKRRPTSGFKW